MERADKDLAFMLQYENIAWYEDGKVRILDRRIYPMRVEYVVCDTHQQVAKAVRDMVTQSAGPFTAASMGMALAAYECRAMDEQAQKKYLLNASETISHARPTTVDRMRRITLGCCLAAETALREGKPVDRAIVEYAIRTNNARYEKIAKAASFLLDMMPNNAKVLTQCFGETIVGQMLKEAKRRNNALKLYCPETRPYFQGARLTASVARDMGFEVTVLTDNMPAMVMQREGIDVYTCAADVICLDGHIVNKVGTFQLAILAKYMGIPFFVSGAPDRGHPTVDTVHIEMRDPEYVLQAMGVRTAMEGVKGYYPAFDITPPQLVSGVVTDCGVYTPYNLNKYYESGNAGEYALVV